MHLFLFFFLIPIAIGSSGATDGSITESQNNSDGKGLRAISNPTPCASVGLQVWSQISHNLYLVGVKNLQG